MTVFLATSRAELAPVARPCRVAASDRAPVRRQPWWDEGAKRALDLFLSGVALVLLAPLLAAVALAVKLDSPGPVFYRGVRVGRGFQRFRIFKFRSMVTGAAMVREVPASRNDPRVTRVGRLLRKYKLDELPNLINVLLGQMSLVGPRPEAEFLTEEYTEEERLILSVRPGITDLASIEFGNQQELIGGGDPLGEFRSRVLPRKNALRLKYVRERSFWGDVRILLATLRLVLSRAMKR